MAENGDISNVWNVDEITRRYLHLLNNDFLSDVNFIIGKDRIRVPGHSWVLVLSSWDFYNVFKLLKLDCYEFVIEDVELSSFMVFLAFCYTLDVYVQDRTLVNTLGILKLARRFHVNQSLIKKCEDHIYCELDADNWMIVHKNRSIFSKDSKVLEKLLTIGCTYFSSIIQLPTNLEIFVDLPLDAVRDVAKLSPINCDEMELFDVLMKWAKRNCEKMGIPPSPQNLRMILKDVFYEIRFPTMKSDWFSYIIKNYPDMLTKREVINISRKIFGYNSNCAFNCEPRLPIEVMHKYFSFGENVIFFAGVPNMINWTTMIMISKFCAEMTKKLTGFAFVVKKYQAVDVITCKLKLPYEDWKNIPTIPGVRSKFNWDYDLIAIEFVESQEIPAAEDPDVYDCKLLCEFDKPVLNLSSKTSLKKDVKQFGINMRHDELNAIPYLIVAKD